MVTLSIIIVNYNVKYFLENCLRSVLKAGDGIDMEVIVVDNQSVDGSVQMVEQKFPQVKLIANQQNTGFAVANNQAIKESAGKYVLLLNPDTVVQEDTFTKCIAFMEEHPDAGALGVKMVDGRGHFLPESKRGLPTPLVSFYKLSGLTGLFPNSKRFGKYYMRHLGEDETGEVEVLAGAFMFMRRSVLDEVGLLDEDFFMYGEDIDLSYRIIKGGYRNYYFPETTIIHYKGESTKRGSLNYVRIFYKAMAIFARKHFSPKLAGLYNVMIYFAIALRALVEIVRNLSSRFSLTFFDVILSFTGVYLIQHLWATYAKEEVSQYPFEFVFIVVPVYVFLWHLSVFLSGGYDRPLKMVKVIRGMFFGTLLIAAIYGFLPNDFRFSRAIILLGSFWTVLSMAFTRFFFNLIINKKVALEEDFEKRVIIVGEMEEAERTLTMLKQMDDRSNFLGVVLPEEQAGKQERVLGVADQIQEIVDLYNVEEIIFCSKNVSSNQIIQWMTTIGSSINYKIVPEESFSIIGSNSKNTAGDLYAIDINLRIDTAEARRNKRIFDLAICFLAILFLPIVLILTKGKLSFLVNLWNVLRGKKTWVAYDLHTEDEIVRLPKLSKGILKPTDGLQIKSISPNTISRVNFLYAKDYSVYNDLQIVLRNLTNLGGV